MEMTHCHCHHCWSTPPTTSLCSHHLYFQTLVWIGKLTFCKVNTFCSVQLFSSIPFLSEKYYYWWSLVPNVDSLWNRLFLPTAPLLTSPMLLGYHLCAAHCHLKLKLKIIEFAIVNILCCKKQRCFMNLLLVCLIVND